jgi:DNA repair protein RadC
VLEPKIEAGIRETAVAWTSPSEGTQPEMVQRSSKLMDRLKVDMSCLTDDEVLELVMAPVTGSKDARIIALALVKKFGTFGRAIYAPAEDLMKIDGLGIVEVAALKTVGAAAIHMMRKAIRDAPYIQIWDDLIKYLIARLQNERVEVLFVIYLDHVSRVISDEELSRGTINRLPGYPREIIRRCLALDATGIILVHNHPSGTLQPSAADIAFTEDVIQAAGTMGVAVYDHLIVAGGECFSFRAHKLMP